MLGAAPFQIRVEAGITLELGLDREAFKNDRIALASGPCAIGALIWPYQ